MLQAKMNYNIYPPVKDTVPRFVTYVTNSDWACLD